MKRLFGFSAFLALFLTAISASAQTGMSNVLSGIFTTSACSTFTAVSAPNVSLVPNNELCFSTSDGVLRQWNGAAWNAIAGPAGAFGTGTLASGTVTISNAAIVAASVCEVSELGSSPTGYLSATVTAGQIVIASSSTTDVKKVSYHCQTP